MRSAGAEPENVGEEEPRPCRGREEMGRLPTSLPTRCRGCGKRKRVVSGVLSTVVGSGAADKTESLAGWKSPCRQLPVFGRLAFLVRAEATKHDRPRCKSPSCPAAVFAAVGTIRGASKLGGRNITEYLQPRNTTLREVVIRGTDAGSRPDISLGKADDTVEETGESTWCTAGVGDPAPKERSRTITS